MGKTALVLIAEGSEEIEAVVAIDVLRRGGVTVDVAHVGGGPLVKCSRDVVIQADKSIQEASGETYDLVVLPGGLGGSKAFAADADVGKLLKKQESEGRIIGAICAAPAVTLPAHGIGKGKSMTCYPCFEEDVKKSGDYKYEEKKVVRDGNLITSQGPGTAFDFGVELVRVLCGDEMADSTAKAMLL